jgi:hypothetical protein
MYGASGGNKTQFVQASDVHATNPHRYIVSSRRASGFESRPMSTIHTLEIAIRGHSTPAGAPRQHLHQNEGDTVKAMSVRKHLRPTLAFLAHLA